MDERDGERKKGRKLFRALLTGLVAGVLGVFAGGMALSVRAADQWPDKPGQKRVYDQAEILSETEEETLAESLQMLREKSGMDAVLVTTNNTGGKSSEQYADDFYDEFGFGVGKDKSGVLYLMDMDNRELVISACGEMLRILTDKRINEMLDAAVNDMADGDYAGCGQRLIENTWHWSKVGIESGQYNIDRETGEISFYKPRKSIRWYEALLSAAVSAVCAGSVCMKVKQDYAMEKERGKISGYYLSYRAGAGFYFHNQNDVLVNSNITRQMIPRTSHRTTSHVRSSGRSTTHRSSSGRRHGGGGRRF